MTQQHIQRLTKEQYPPMLQQIFDTPKQLYVRGQIPDLPMIAIVGSRKMTNVGKRALQYLLSGCANAPFCVVSGLALGVDGWAHQLAIKHNLPTVAVLGGGVSDRSIGPRRHLSLAHDIIAHGGAVLSEYEPTEPPFAGHFPERNRIIAALASATLVVEAADKSGALITAFVALEYNRDVAVIPHSIFHPNGRGINRLLKRGAVPITEPADILQLLHIDLQTGRQKSIFLTENEQQFIAIFAEKPLFLDEICSATNLTVAQVMIQITPLLKREILEQQQDGKYALTAPCSPSET